MPALPPELERARRTPLDKISLDQAEEIARRITRQPATTTVEVARFGSSV